MNIQFTTMLYNNRHLVVKTTEAGNLLVICECYLEGFADQICKLLTEAENKLTSDKQHRLDMT